MEQRLRQVIRPKKPDNQTGATKWEAETFCELAQFPDAFNSLFVEIQEAWIFLRVKIWPVARRNG